jgi:cytochrome P450
MEMRIVVARVLERASLRAADPEPEEVQFRAITLSPRNGTRVVMTRAPSAADLSDVVGAELQAGSR